MGIGADNSRGVAIDPRAAARWRGIARLMHPSDRIGARSDLGFLTVAWRVCLGGIVSEPGMMKESSVTGSLEGRTDTRVWEATPEIHEQEHKLLSELRQLRRTLRSSAQHLAEGDDLTVGQRLADGFAAVMGSWKFIIIQSVILTAWVVLNVTAWVRAWDPYPFILLNLALSFQAAYAAPIIMMSQNRQQDVDRAAAENDYKINIKAELEIELLHHKLDKLREQEVLELSKAVRELSELLQASRRSSDDRD